MNRPEAQDRDDLVMYEQLQHLARELTGEPDVADPSS